MLNWCRRGADHRTDGAISLLQAERFDQREKKGSATLSALRSHGVTGLAISTDYSGSGLAARELVEVAVALGSVAPSAAIAVNMHTFSVASLVALQGTDPNVWAILEAIAGQSLFVASGFAEGRPGRSAIAPLMTGVRIDGGYVVNGVKRPCSLARSMDILSASFALDDSETHYGVGLIPATDPGVRVEDFWTSPFLAGAESDAVIVTDAFVAHETVIRVARTSTGDVNVQNIGFAWFEMLMSAAYLGMVERLVELALEARDTSRVTAVIQVVPALYESLFALADRVDTGVDAETLSVALSVRSLVQRVIDDIVPVCLDVLGGTGFIRNGEVGYLAGATQCLRFHPPTMTRMSDSDNLSIYRRVLSEIS